MSGGKLGIVVGYFISSIVILGFCNGIVLVFFRGGHIVVIGVLFNRVIEVMLWVPRLSLITSMVKYGVYEGTLGSSFFGLEYR